MHRTRLKICGVTSVEDAAVAARLGADAIGLVFYEKSPRYIELDIAHAIVASLPAFVTTVALFKDADATTVSDTCKAISPDLLQFHGSESAAFAGSFAQPYIKALGVDGDSELIHSMEQFSQSQGILLDSHAPGAAGGTGKAFDWELIPSAVRQKIILAGGITPDNVAECIMAVRPYAIDVSSGVESAPGVKDQGKIQKLINEIRRADG